MQVDQESKSNPKKKKQKPNKYIFFYINRNRKSSENKFSKEENLSIEDCNKESFIIVYKIQWLNSITIGKYY